jgi:hypothetical protein
VLIKEMNMRNIRIAVVSFVVVLLGALGLSMVSSADAAQAPGGGLSVSDVDHVKAVGGHLTKSKGKHVKAVKVKGSKVFDELFPDVTLGGPGGDQTAGLKAQDLVVVQSTGDDIPQLAGRAYGTPLHKIVTTTTVMDSDGWVVAEIGAAADAPDTAREKKDLVKTFGTDVADVIVDAT